MCAVHSVAVFCISFRMSRTCKQSKAPCASGLSVRLFVCPLEKSAPNPLDISRSIYVINFSHDCRQIMIFSHTRP